MIHSKKDLPTKLRGGPTSQYAWVPEELANVTVEDYLLVEVPEGKTFRTMRNCVTRQLARSAPKPPKGYRWTTQALTEDGEKSLAIFLEKDSDTGTVAQWAYGGEEV